MRKLIILSLMILAMFTACKKSNVDQVVETMDELSALYDNATKEFEKCSSAEELQRVDTKFSRNEKKLKEKIEEVTESDPELKDFDPKDSKLPEEDIEKLENAAYRVSDAKKAMMVSVAKIVKKYMGDAIGFSDELDDAIIENEDINEDDNSESEDE